MKRKTTGGTVAEQTRERAAPDLVRQVGNTTLDIYVHFSKTSKETFTDKVVRLIQNDGKRLKQGVRGRVTEKK